MSATIIKEPGIWNLAKDPIFIQFESDLFSPSAPYMPTVDNLQAYVEVVALDDANNETLILPINAPYDNSDKRTFFDIHSIFNLKPTLPTKESFVWDTAIQYGEATNSFQKFRLKYADKFGSPPVSLSFEQFLSRPIH